MEINTLKSFVQLLSEELEIDSKNILPEHQFRELKNWSSLNALLILSRIQEETGQLISPTKLAIAKTVADFYNLIEK